MTEIQVTESLDAESIDTATAEITDAAAPIESDTPGSVLLRTREARGQSIADVVQVIRFSPRQIEALERDDYASLPGSTAVRGMVRNYAKFLKLDAAPLLAQLDPAVPVPEADVRPPANIGEAEQPTVFKRVSLKFVTAGIAILLLVLTGYWYLNLPADEGLMQRLLGVGGTPEVVSPNPVATAAVVTVLAPSPAVIADGERTGSGLTSGQLPLVGLRVEFDDRSWIEIRDATQKTVFDGVYPAGTRQNVEGKPPFQVWIGKASGVRLFMGERSIDLKPHTRAEVARFSLE